MREISFSDCTWVAALEAVVENFLCIIPHVCFCKWEINWKQRMECSRCLIEIELFFETILSWKMLSLTWRSFPRAFDAMLFDCSNFHLTVMRYNQNNIQKALLTQNKLKESLYFSQTIKHIFIHFKLLCIPINKPVLSREHLKV